MPHSPAVSVAAPRSTDHSLHTLLGKLDFRAWLTARRERKRSELRQKGYDYAAGRLLMAKDKARMVEFLRSCAANPFDYNEFDEGIELALKDFSQQKS